MSASHTSGSVLLNPPLLGDVDRRDMFYCYLNPGKQESGKVNLSSSPTIIFIKQEDILQGTLDAIYGENAVLCIFKFPKIYCHYTNSKVHLLLWD